jgi:glycyl-tRNA synthetase beta chain
VTHLVEAPTPFRGTFDDEFLEVPDAVLIESMQDHQWYFPVADDDGLLPYFIGVRNGGDDHLETVREGNEKVLRARLNDAKFFYENDLETEYEDYREQLKGVVFQEELGSLYDKTERMAGILSEFDQVPESLPHIARHCKNDLVTDMVEEFPKLQGTMGKIYATESGWGSGDADIIESHYKPEDRADEIPDEPSAQMLALLDRIDTLVGFFALGERPSGSSDPYGLRRDALGVIRLILSGSLPEEFNDIGQLIDAVKEGYDGTSIQVDESINDDLEEFFRERLVNFAESSSDHFEGAGSAPFFHQALEASVSRFWNDPNRVKQRYRWITREWGLSDPQSLVSLLEAYQRIDNILASESVPDGTPSPDRFEHDVEEELWNAVRTLDDTLDEALESSDEDRVFEGLTEIVSVINDFFETVLVNVDDPDVQSNRLCLLNNIRRTFDRVADFSRISPKETPTN